MAPDQYLRPTLVTPSISAGLRALITSSAFPPSWATQNSMACVVNVIEVNMTSGAIVPAQQAGTAKAADCAQVPADLSFVMRPIVIGGG